MVIGFGNQGKKRARVLGDRLIATIDPFSDLADYASILEALHEVEFSKAFVCVPDSEKSAIIDQLIDRSIHILVEKPLNLELTSLQSIQAKASEKRVAIYTAYNHRFEPAIRKVKSILDSGVIGSVYSSSMYYGNGTAALVRESPWRDHKSGVIWDLGSHLLDLHNFLFNESIFTEFRLVGCHRHENQSPDHALICGEGSFPMYLEMSLCSWRNSFKVDIVGSEGSVHVDSLCKWGPSTVTLNRRLRPSGKPPCERWIWEQNDPTWQLENDYFLAMCDDLDRYRSQLDTDIAIANCFSRLDL